MDGKGSSNNTPGPRQGDLWEIVTDGRNCTVPDLVGSTSMLSVCVVGLDVDVEGENSKGRLGREVQPERDERSAEPKKGGERERDIGLWLWWWLH